MRQIACGVCIGLLLWAWGSARPDEMLGEDTVDPSSEKSIQPKWETIVVTADRYEEDPFDSGRAVSLVPLQRIEELSSRSTPEILDDHPGVYVQKTNHGGGQPIIRGRYGNQILILYDGVRVNNSIFRGGANQYLNTVGPFLLERVEVLRGPSSVEFGSDAIGGTVNVIPQAPCSGQTEDRESLLGFRTQVATMDTELTNQVFARGVYDPWSAQVGLSYSDFGDLRAGGGVGRQAHTGYEQSTYDAQVAYRSDADRSVKIVYSGIRQINVPRTDVFTPEDRMYYDEQFRDLAYLKTQAGHLGGSNLDLDAALSLQSHREKWRRTRLDKEIEERQWVEVTTLGGWAQLLIPLGNVHTLVGGVEMYHDWVESGQKDWYLDGGFAGYKRGKFAPRATYSLLGVYLKDEWSLTDGLVFKTGGRLTGYAADVPEEEVVGRIQSRSIGVVGSAALLWRPRADLNLNLGVHQGFRAPNLYDLTATGKFAGGFDVANPDLEPERATTCELGLKWANRWFMGSLFYYYTFLDDLIARNRWTINGSSQFEGLDVYHRENLESAAVQGVELEAEIVLTPGLVGFVHATWTEGNDLSAKNTPLSRIPPMNGALGIRWQDGEERWFAEVYGRFARRQARLSEQDIGDVRIGPQGTRGYIALHARAGYRWGHGVRWFVHMVNLTDQGYRIHGSGIDQPGFGVRTSLEFRI